MPRRLIPDPVVEGRASHLILGSTSSTVGPSVHFSLISANYPLHSRHPSVNQRHQYRTTATHHRTQHGDERKTKGCLWFRLPLCLTGLGAWSVFFEAQRSEDSSEAAEPIMRVWGLQFLLCTTDVPAVSASTKSSREGGGGGGGGGGVCLKLPK